MNLLKKTLFCAVAAGITGCAFCTPVITLPKPALPPEISLVSAMQKRKSTREFTPIAPDALEQVKANLLWAATGSNRPDGKRVTPAAIGRYAVLVYLADRTAIYRFDRNANKLLPVADGDFLSLCAGNQKMCAKATLALIFVIDEKVWDDRGKDEWAALEAGAMMQNVYLYCASAKLGTVACASFQEKPLEKALKLADDHEIFLTMLVGGEAK